MSGFRNHFLDKYFAYRVRYVAAVTAEKPHRARLAVAAEIARLGFVAAGTALVALVLWLLVAGSFGRIGIGLRTVGFTLFAVGATYLGGRTIGGLARALKAYRQM